MGNICCTAAGQVDDDISGDELAGNAKGQAPSQANGHADQFPSHSQSAEATVCPADSLTPNGPASDRIHSDDEYWTCETSLSGVDLELEFADGMSMEATPRCRSQTGMGKLLRPEPPRLSHSQSQVHAPTWQEKLREGMRPGPGRGAPKGMSRALPADQGCGKDGSTGPDVTQGSLIDTHRALQGGLNHHRHRWWSHSTHSENQGGWQHHRLHGHGTEGCIDENGVAKPLPRVRSMDHHVRLATVHSGSPRRPRRSLTGVHNSSGASQLYASVRSFFHDFTVAWPWRHSGASRDSNERRSLSLDVPPGSRRLIRPVAGATLVKYPLEALRPGGVAATDYCFSVRGGDYFRDKKKITSMPPGYKLLGADVFAAEKKINHIAPYLQLPEVPTALAKAAGDLPPLLVINCQVPSYEPSIFSRCDNGEGCSLVLYFMLDEAFTTQQDSPEFNLAKRFLSNNDEHCKSKEGRSKVRDQLKIVARFVNAEELELSSIERNLISSYNEKPVLSRPQHCFFQGDGYLEIDVDVHRFSYIAVKGLYSFKDRMGQISMDLGFVIQGNDKSELPERMLATVRLCKLPIFTSGNILELMDL